MSEVLTDTVQQLAFSSVLAGDLIGITTGTEDEAWLYEFTAEDTSHLWPSGQLRATTPSGEGIGPLPFELHGCGRWTTQRQNPVQKQTGLAFTPYYEGLIVGSFLWGKEPGAADRLVFDKPGQEISSITLTPFRENLLLGVLGEAGQPLTVSQIIEALPEASVSAELSPHYIRQLLAGLAMKGLIEHTRQKTHTFHLKY